MIHAPFRAPSHAYSLTYSRTPFYTSSLSSSHRYLFTQLSHPLSPPLTLTSPFTSLPAEMTPWTVNTVPKLFRMLPLPQERLLHNWYRDNESEFEALFDHVQQETENETKRLLAMRTKGMFSL